MSNARQNRVLLQICAIAILLALAAPAEFAGQTPDVATIVAHMSRVELQAMSDQRAYELTRKYQIFEKDQAVPRTEVLARIDFVPPGEKKYEIAESTGGMGERAIRHALDREVDLTRNPERAEMTERNYSFTLAGEAELNGRRCWILESHPKRDDKDLLKAKLWVDEETYLILRIAGHPQKNPSFWVKDIHVVMDYGEISGMWMHTATRAEADIRFTGQFTVVSHDLSLQAEPMVVNAAARRPRHSNTPALVGVAIP